MLGMFLVFYLSGSQKLTLVLQKPKFPSSVDICGGNSNYQIFQSFFKFQYDISIIIFKMIETST
jgi:hypothetical protein